jgi:two-component system LytT family response regulator
MTAIVVDDERLARRRLERLLLKEPDVDVTALCENVREARRAVIQDAPDVIFADIEMPRASGFDLVDAARPGAVPAVIFVTAYERYAVQAFDAKACDYLLKPVVEQRLRVAVQRARELVFGRGGERAGDATRRGPVDPPVDARPDAVLVPCGDRTLRVPLERVDWIEAAGNYVQLHVEGAAYLLRETLAALESRLPAGRFVRIHRAVIANVDRIVAFEPTPGGDFWVTLRGGGRLRLSRTYRGQIRDVLGRSI